jgi:transcriptional regulator
MYIPPRYRVTDDAVIDAFIRAHGFAMLVTAGSAGIMASHIPLELGHDENGARVLRGHLSKANAQWKQLDETGQAMAVFLGPHTYISPTWYDHPNVPTWNYQAVHAYGTVRVVHDPAMLHPDLKTLAEHYEPPSSPPPRFDLDAMPADLRGAEMKGIAGFVMQVTRVDAAFKLSQNRHDADQARIIAELEAQGDDASRGVADAMKERGKG